MKQSIFFITVVLLLISCSDKQTTNSNQKPVKIILDTDFGDDGDDLLVVAMLHHLQDVGECEILAIGQSNSNKVSACAIDVINTYYGRPDIPIGIVQGEVHGVADQYGTYLLENYPNMYDINIDSIPSSVDIYRKTLAEAKDSSVVFVVIGFKKSMADLLKSKPDDISPLTGVELVSKKVKFISDMAGWYPIAPKGDNIDPPFNFGIVNGVAKYYVDSCPVPMLFTGLRTGEIGLAKELRKQDNLLGRTIDYKLSHDGGWGKEIEEYQAAFDCVSALIAVRNPEMYFHIKHGCNSVDSLGYNSFSYKKNCGHSHIDCQNRKVSFDELTDIIEDMLITLRLAK